MNDVLNPEVLKGIVPFSGTPEQMQGAEKMMMEGMALQRVQTRYTTAVAVQQPRSFSRFSANVLEEAKLAGEAFFYRWEVWDKNKNAMVPIEGPSIDLAMCLARNYGNDVVDIEVVSESNNHFILKGYFIDLETGFTCPRLFRQRKGQRISGKMDADRQEDIVFQIGQSKAIRNAVVRAMPKWLVDQAIETAKKAEAGKAAVNLPAARAKAVSYFQSEHSVTQKMLEDKVGKVADEWQADDIVNIKGMATALKEARITVQDLFYEAKEEEPGEDPKPETSTDKVQTGEQKKEETETKETEPGEEEEPDGKKKKWEFSEDPNVEGIIQQFWRMRNTEHLVAYIEKNAKTLSTLKDTNLIKIQLDQKVANFKNKDKKNNPLPQDYKYPWLVDPGDPPPPETEPEDPPPEESETTEEPEKPPANNAAVPFKKLIEKFDEELKRRLEEDKHPQVPEVNFEDFARWFSESAQQNNQDIPSLKASVMEFDRFDSMWKAYLTYCGIEE